MPRPFRYNGSHVGHSNIGTVFEMAFITTYLLLPIKYCTAFSLSKFDSQQNSLASTMTEKKCTGNAAFHHEVSQRKSLIWNIPKVSLWKLGNKKSLKSNGRLSSTSLSFQFSGTLPSLEETLVAFSPKEISNTLRPFEGWYNKWDATGNPSCYSEWGEEEDEDTLKSLTYSWPAYPTEEKSELTSEKDNEDRSTSASSSGLFPKNKNDEMLSGPRVITRILMQLLILLTAGAKIGTLV